MHIERGNERGLFVLQRISDVGGESKREVSFVRYKDEERRLEKGRGRMRGRVACENFIGVGQAE